MVAGGEEIVDGLSEPVPQSVKQQREENMVRDLDDWKRFQQTKVKNKPGENLDLLTRIQKMMPESTKQLVAKYTEWQLRQRITPRNLIRDVFLFEEQKNEYVLRLFSVFQDSLLRSIVDLNNKATSFRNKAEALRKHVGQSEDEIERLRQAQAGCREYMVQRKVQLKNEGKLVQLRRQAIMRDQSKALADPEEPSLAQELNDESAAQLEGRPAGSQADSIDIYDFDARYLKKKREYHSYTAVIGSRLWSCSGLVASLRSSNAEIAEAEKVVVRAENELRQSEERELEVKKLKLEYLRVILKHGLDSRFEGCVWIMRECSMLGAAVREEMLPDFLDPDSKKFLLAKHKLYSKIADLYDKIDFNIKLYKTLSGDQAALDKIKEELLQSRRKEQANPMWDAVAEMNSIAIQEDHRPDSLYHDRSLQSALQPEPPEAQSAVDIRRKEVTHESMADQPNTFLTNVNAGLSDEVLGSREVRAIKKSASFLGERVSFPQEADDFALRAGEESQAAISDAGRHTLTRQASEYRLQRHAVRSNYTGAHHRSLQSGLSKEQLIPIQSAKFSRKSYLTGGRTVVSAAFTSLAEKKRKQFEAAGVVYIGDPQYDFPYAGKFARVDQVLPETAVIGNRLVEKCIRQERLEGGAKTKADRSLSDSRGPQDLSQSVAADAGIADLYDGLNTHVQFYEDGELLNTCKSRLELSRLFEQFDTSSSR